ncbi:catalase [Facklamia miroungae]|uniref:Catalase n=1 Tax=Facklamia miroungae TaxID=120956 RepID=A0A1G7TCD9_9LACT|nr:catalase [Facklamia miroungae]NKZ29761.1 catalase [Facklamia miroungae]SDG32895.1 catalase [Facklamia miroungae]
MTDINKNKTNESNEKIEDLKKYYTNDADSQLTTNKGVKMSNDNFTLKAGQRGPSLMQDFHYFEKMQHFSRERIPERVVHARGTGAHGTFTVTKNAREYSAADFLSEEGKKTPIFIRFSTVQGFRGSADTVRDNHGFAVKFYTQDGNFDLPGVTHPVFFINDAIKFPDLIHSVKPEPKDEVPQGQSAHDSFWDFIANNPETLHNVCWTMSDRAIPRSYRMMEGFPIHTYKLVNEKREVFFCRFHFKPDLGVHSLVWEEAQKIQGMDPDFHRKDLMEAIDKGDFPTWTFGAQIIKEEEEFMFDFDILDATKLWPEEIVPVTEFGKIELNKNVENFFAETEQSAFNPANLVRGIETSDDPLLQGRLFAYNDAHHHRLGSANFEDLPINRPIPEVHNNQRDGFMQYKINTTPTNYGNNSRLDNAPKVTPWEEGGYETTTQNVEGMKTRSRILAFKDFYTQPRLFLNSLTEVERQHCMNGFSFELTKVKSEEVRQQVVNQLGRVDRDFAQGVADHLNLKVKVDEGAKFPADEDGNIESKDFNYGGKSVEKSPALSQEKTVKKPDTLKLAVLIASGANQVEVGKVIKALEDQGIYITIISEKLGYMDLDKERKIMEAFNTADMVLFDALYLAGMNHLKQDFKADVQQFLDDAFTHFKPILVGSDSEDFVAEERLNEPGLFKVTDSNETDLLEGITMMRFWDRDKNK